MKYDNEIRTGRNVKQLVHRALQFAMSDPKGPAYLMGAREVMEEQVEPVRIDAGQWTPIEPPALPAAAVMMIVDALATARRPLIVTSYLGRNPAAVPELVRLAETYGAGVLESVPNAMNMPHGHQLYLGNQWNEPRQNPALAEADLVLVIDSDVPWIPTVSRPADDALIIHLDVDPLKQAMPLWYIGARHSHRADAAAALAQLNATARPCSAAAGRTAHYRAMGDARRQALAAKEVQPAARISPEYLTACVRQHLDDSAIVLNEGITNYGVIFDHLRMTRPGSIFTSGGGSLGWNGGAAIGAKLAAPGSTVVAMSGDGSYMFSVPSSVHWMAAKYGAPFLQVVFNNDGWRAPRASALAVHPDGYASRANDLDIGFDPAPRYADIAAAAGDAWARRVERPSELEAALAEAFTVVRGGRAAVLDVLVS